MKGSIGVAITGVMPVGRDIEEQGNDQNLSDFWDKIERYHPQVFVSVWTARWPP